MRCYRLGELGFTWYSHVDGKKSVEIVNYFQGHAESCEVVFIGIYSDAGKRLDHSKEDTGLFFKEDEGKPFATCNAGGGFAYVAALHDSFPPRLRAFEDGLQRLRPLLPSSGGFGDGGPV